MNRLYPEIEPFNVLGLKVSPLHEIYIEECGNPKGVPVVFVHGGPGAGCSKDNRRFFDPKHYRIILFDQRGCGRSKPFADLRENTTWDLVADMEKIREQLKIEKWFVFGGSWGSTLGLAYGVTHPERCLGLCLRGIFLCRPHEIAWLYQEGASRLFPEDWQDYLAPIPIAERGDMVKAYYKLMTDPDPAVRQNAAISWTVWEGKTSYLIPNAQTISRYENPEFALAFGRIECHYFINNAFFKTENYLLEQASKLKNIPVEIVHGRYDVVCPIENAFELHKAVPHSKYYPIADAGHSVNEPGITDRVVEILNRWRSVF